jgi:ABC-type glycerol-3-phosphate transport system substrate-binding protein
MVAMVATVSAAMVTCTEATDTAGVTDTDGVTDTTEVIAASRRFNDKGSPPGLAGGLFLFYGFGSWWIVLSVWRWRSVTLSI